MSLGPMAKAVSACIGEEVYLCNIANSQVAASYCPARQARLL